MRSDSLSVMILDPIENLPRYGSRGRVETEFGNKPGDCKEMIWRESG